MKKQFKTLVCTTSLTMLAAAALAQSAAAPSTSSSPSSDSSAYQSSGGSQTSSSQQSEGMQGQQQFFQAKNFIGEKVHNSQDQSLGTIKDIVFNPQNGETFAAIEASHNRYALVPWQALTIKAKGSRGKELVVLNATKEQLQAGPTVPEDQWQMLNNQTFVQSIYSHYNVQPPTGLGGSAGTGTSGTSTGTSGDTSSQGTSKSSQQSPSSR